MFGLSLVDNQTSTFCSERGTEEVSLQENSHSLYWTRPGESWFCSRITDLVEAVERGEILVALAGKQFHWDGSPRWELCVT